MNMMQPSIIKFGLYFFCFLAIKIIIISITLENFSVFLIAFSIIAILLVIAFVIRNVEKFSTFAFFWTSILISGIFCNLYERIHFGYVRDFFKLNFIEFPIFNISDIFINIGVITIIIIIIKNKYLKK